MPPGEVSVVVVSTDTFPCGVSASATGHTRFLEVSFPPKVNFRPVGSGRPQPY